jgi:CHAT domain-containing protein/tetratricopeptide (TPR) repeat protein
MSFVRFASALALCGVLSLATAAACRAEEATAPAGSPATQAAIDEITRDLERHYAAGDFAEAARVAGTLLAARERSLPPDHFEIAVALEYLGASYQGLGKTGEAEPLFKRALGIWEEALGADHAELASRLQRLAGLYSAQGRYGEAGPLLVRGLAIRESKLAPDHVDVAESLAMLGAHHMRLGRYGDAEPLFLRALSIREKAGGSDAVGFASLLNDLAALRQAQTRYAEVEPLFKRALAMLESASGSDNPAIATTLNNLASFYQAQARLTETEPLYKRSLAISEKALGPEHPETGLVLQNMAVLYLNQGRYGDAEPLFERSIAVREKAHGAEHPAIGQALGLFALLRRQQGRYGEAEEMQNRAIAILEKALGPDHIEIAEPLTSLAVVYRNQGQFAAGEPLLRRSLAIREKVLGPGHDHVARSLDHLARNLADQGRYSEAEPIYRRAIAVAEKALGPEHPDLGEILNDLAELYDHQARFGEAEAALARALSIGERALGQEHADVARLLNNLASVQVVRGRHPEAEAHYRRALAIREKALGPGHPLVGQSLNNLAALYLAMNVADGVEPLLQRGLEIREKALGPDHASVAPSLINLAAFYRDRGRFDEAEPLMARAVAITRAAMGPEHPKVAEALSSRAWLAASRSDWRAARDLWRDSTAILQRRTRLGVGAASETTGMKEASRSSWQFAGYVKAAHRMAGQDGAALEASAREMFETAQWARHSEAATALSQLAARSAAGSSVFAALVRERQDLLAEKDNKEQRLLAAITGSPAERRPGVEAAVAARLKVVEARLAEIAARLSEEPAFAPLSLSSVAVAEVQADLRDSEALVLFLDTPAIGAAAEESFVWVVTRSDVRWARIEAGTTALAEAVDALRCGLDASAWRDKGGIACRRLLRVAENPADDAALPFSVPIAHELYETLFGQVEDLIAGKSLLIVPSGPLTRLPFHVLAVKEQGAADMKAVRWLVRDHALTVLPSVASLKALRRATRPSAAARPSIGFGNPLLDGLQSDPDHGSGFAELARQARIRKGCAEATRKRTGALRGMRRSLIAPEQAEGLASLRLLRMQTPLPETADELCAVARSLSSDVDEVRLGARATESEVKQLSATGELARYRVVHFATHGTLPGQVPGIREPGLVLTPPDAATAEDDGYLSAPEIAGLKLDADWVILSACNTAAGEGEGEAAEALSGLARAFFYAGARAILVSHWEVESEAATRLITGAIGTATHAPHEGRAEALRRAMLALVDNGSPEEAMPSFWAPFIVAGEGGAAR